MPTKTDAQKARDRIRRNAGELADRGGHRWHAAKALRPSRLPGPGSKVVLIECYVCRATIGHFDRVHYELGDGGGWVRHEHQPVTIKVGQFNMGESLSAGRPISAEDFRS